MAMIPPGTGGPPPGPFPQAMLGGGPQGAPPAPGGPPPGAPPGAEVLGPFIKALAQGFMIGTQLGPAAEAFQQGMKLAQKTQKGKGVAPGGAMPPAGAVPPPQAAPPMPAPGGGAPGGGPPGLPPLPPGFQYVPLPGGQIGIRTPQGQIVPLSALMGAGGPGGGGGGASPGGAAPPMPPPGGPA